MTADRAALMLCTLTQIPQEQSETGATDQRSLEMKNNSEQSDPGQPRLIIVAVPEDNQL